MAKNKEVSFFKGRHIYESIFNILVFEMELKIL
jgi:hypothetical protein